MAVRVTVAAFPLAHSLRGVDVLEDLRSGVDAHLGEREDAGDEWHVLLGVVNEHQSPHPGRLGHQLLHPPRHHGVRGHAHHDLPGHLLRVQRARVAVAAPQIGNYIRSVRSDGSVQ
jgi:hypothetical protein